MAQGQTTSESPDQVHSQPAQTDPQLLDLTGQEPLQAGNVSAPPMRVSWPQLQILMRHL